MERRGLLKQSCGMAACSCLAMASLGLPSAEAAEPDASKPKLQDWQIDFMRARLENLLQIIATTLDGPTRAEVLGRLGRECAKEVVKGFEGNPEGFWDHIKGMWLERVDYDTDKGVVRIWEKPRTDCNCPLAALMKVPTTMCSCSVGTQEAIYETLFGRRATAVVEESVLRGDKRCAFTITLEP
jgi:predicted hydrocarbon binding protein